MLRHPRRCTRLGPRSLGDLSFWASKVKRFVEHRCGLRGDADLGPVNPDAGRYGVSLPTIMRWRTGCTSWSKPALLCSVSIMQDFFNLSEACKPCVSKSCSAITIPDVNVCTSTHK